jgi:hypothetical protein
MSETETTEATAIKSMSVVHFSQEYINLGDDGQSAIIYRYISQRLKEGDPNVIQRTSEGQLLYSDGSALYDITGAQLDRKGNKQRPLAVITKEPGLWRSWLQGEFRPDTKPDLAKYWAEWGSAPAGLPLTVTEMLAEAGDRLIAHLRIEDGDEGQLVMVNREYLRLVVPYLADFEQYSLRLDLTPDHQIVRVRTLTGALMALIRPMAMRDWQQQKPDYCPFCNMIAPTGGFYLKVSEKPL